MDDDSHMTRQQYRREKMMRDRALKQSDNREESRSGSIILNENEIKIRNLARHLDRMIWILLVLIVVVYLILVFINF